MCKDDIFGVQDPERGGIVYCSLFIQERVKIINAIWEVSTDNEERNTDRPCWRGSFGGQPGFCYQVFIDVLEAITGEEVKQNVPLASKCKGG
ncbi:MAG: hypothetical protein D5R97_07805 [Candidatus Syntrophonatronum acetioxidans]|uniref:Uncharacterized protein n=1 Tax=Candidatus Syntrophonatronum acetioxidans TaxID=1795816 RepID=A0A424YBM7_9FIRM|nr:MAG: hypothetical protein D5R97_07805 [Candidatus Syntrophonatronum acetioxidans]